MVPSLDLIHRVDEAATAYTIARMRVLEGTPGNPTGIAVRATDNVFALMAKHLPSPAFNAVTGLRRGHAGQIQPLVKWYCQHGVTGRFEIASGDDDPALGRELPRLGYFQSGCHAALIREPDLHGWSSDEIAVELVTSGDQMEEFLAAYVAGWSMPEAWQDQFKQYATLARSTGLVAVSCQGRRPGRCNCNPFRQQRCWLSRRFGNRPGVPRTWHSLRAAAPPRAGRACSWCRVRLQRCRFPLDEPPQHGARRHATPVLAINLDAARLSRSPASSRPGNSAASGSGSGASTCAAPSPRSAGCVRASR
jgi:hypothetical protein